jgi:N-methylhydantoinase A
MGGTTAKACMIERGEPLRAGEYEIGATASVGSRLLKGAGYLLRVRSIDVAEVGAGGGSIVEADPAGGIRVGPESAGATPGPICYGRGGDRPTVTDANVLLGYLSGEALLGGSLPVDAERARLIWERAVARPTSLSVEASALGTHRLANANMERAVRLVSTERGFDPRSATLIAFGGSGPVHAAGLAASIGIPRVVVPPAPGVFSALGLLTVSVGQEFVSDFHRRLDPKVLEPLQGRWEAMEAEAATELAGPGSGLRPRYERLLDLRYEGQHRELTVRFPHPDVDALSLRLVADGFHREFHRTFGYTTPEPITIENVRLVASVEAIRSPLDGVLQGLARPATER